MSYGHLWDNLRTIGKRLYCEFPDPKTGLFQIEWRDNGRRLTRSLKHRDWRRAKRQADEFAAGYLGPEIEGKAEAESEPLTLERLFDIYGEEVTPTKVERVRHRDRTATRMFLDFLGRDRRPETLSQRGLGPLHPGAAGGQGRAERQAGGQPDDRMRLEVPARGPQTGPSSPRTSKAARSWKRIP